MIFGDLNPETILDEEIADIRACVEERGAMVVFIVGDRFMPLGFAESPLAELLPVSLTNAEGRVTAEWRQGAFPFAVTGAGYAHEIMQLSESDSENVRIWQSGCEWQRRLEGLTVKPGAEILAFAGDSSAIKSPLLVVQHRGRGRVVFLASDETWRFRYRIGDTYHHRFWGNVLRWGAGAKLRDGNAYARVGTDRIHYAPGDRVKIRTRLMDADSLPMDGLELSCTVRDPKGGSREFPLKARNLANGTYEGEFAETTPIGAYSVEIACKEARRRLGDKWPAKGLATSFEVKTAFAPLEYAHLSSDRALADEMAKLTSGEVLLLGGTNGLQTLDLRPQTTNQPPNRATAEPLNFDFGAGRSEVVDHIESHIWDHPLGFIVLAAALILVWILRKRRGLA